MTDLRHRLSELDQLDPPDIRASIDRRTRELRSAPPKALVRSAGQWWRGPLITVATTVAVLVVVAVSMLVLRTTEPDVADEPIATQTTIEAATTTTPPTVTTNAAEVPVDPAVLDWSYDIHDVEIAPDGLVYAVAPVGIATLSGTGEWTLIDVTGLPEGSGLDDGFPGRTISAIAIGADGELWVAGSAASAVNDQEFGGVVNEWVDAQFLTWFARRDCAVTPCSWHVFTSDEIPDLAGDVGDIVVSDEGTVYASVGENLLLVFNGTGWESHAVADLGNVVPWSGSIAVAPDGVVWVGTNAPEGEGQGLYSFDGSEFTWHSVHTGLPSNYTFQVTAAADGSIWVATDALYDDPSTASPDTAAVVARYDGTKWINYTMDDGLLSNDAVIATGPDGTVWAIHYEIPPYGYARFNGMTWTAYPTDEPGGGFRAAVDANGTLWTTANGELISFNGTTTTAYASPFTRP